MSKFAFALALVVPLAALAACSSKTTPSKTTDTSGATAKSAKKGSVAKGATDAKSAGQKSGSNATSHKSDATDQGADFEQATCDAELEGTAWCGDDHTAIFCSDGHWYALDCASIGGELCAETIDSHVVDCDAPDIVE